jgi:hypothetical protein
MRIPFKQYPSPAKANRGRYVMPITLKPLPSPLMGADKGRYVMRIPFEHLPSPLMGEGSGGGEDSTSSPPIPTFPRQGGRGIAPYESLLGEGCLAV